MAQAINRWSDRIRGIIKGGGVTWIGSPFAMVDTAELEVRGFEGHYGWEGRG